MKPLERLTHRSMTVCTKTVAHTDVCGVERDTRRTLFGDAECTSTAFA